MSNRNIVRWYLMSYTYGRKGLRLGLEQELERRKRDGEEIFEYFAPTYVETKEVDGRLVSTKTSLLYNYFFVHASENEIFRMKRHQPQYNLLRRITNSDGSYHYPYVKDSTIEMLQWIAKSYSGLIPLCLLDQTLLVKGDRIRITKGQFKGVVARIVSRPKSSHKEIMVFVENWMCVPLMNVRPNQYEVIDINDTQAEKKSSQSIDDPRLSAELHEALCRYHRGETTSEDIQLADRTIIRFSDIEPQTMILRCKLYSYLLPACRIANSEEKFEDLVKIIKVMLPKIKAEQSLALMLVTLYACTDSCFYHERVHQVTQSWKEEETLKRGKRLLLDRLADYDRCLGH